MVLWGVRGPAYSVITTLHLHYYLCSVHAPKKWIKFSSFISFLTLVYIFLSHDDIPHVAVAFLGGVLFRKRQRETTQTLNW